MGRLAAKGECLGGGPFIPLTRSLPLTKYKPSLMTLWGVRGIRVGNQYHPELPLCCLPVLEANHVIKSSLRLALVPLVPGFQASA